MVYNLQSWLRDNHPEVLKEWLKVFKGLRRDYMRKYQKTHYIPAALIHEYEAKARKLS